MGMKTRSEKGWGIINGFLCKIEISRFEDMPLINKIL